MASGPNPHVRPTAKSDGPPADEPTDAFGDWGDDAVLADPAPAPMPVVSRASTVDDPMTTGLLAEASRVTQTAELTQEQIEEAHRAALLLPPEEPKPASPRLIRRSTRITR